MNNINFRQAIVCTVLVGSYLMVPPLYQNGTTDLSVPLSEWRQIDVFDTAPECVAGADEVYNDAKADKDDPVQVKRENAAECIATDDPRLKGN